MYSVDPEGELEVNREISIQLSRLLVAVGFSFLPVVVDCGTGVGGRRRRRGTTHKYLMRAVTKHYEVDELSLPLYLSICLFRTILYLSLSHPDVLRMLSQLAHINNERVYSSFCADNHGNVPC